jgi:hypothetical protein
MQTSGFFNAQKVNGRYDREYNADHYSDNLAVIISDGVLRSSNDDLKVTASGMTVTVGIGRAWIKGKWYKNDVPYVFNVPTAPTTGTRIDRVVLRYDNTREVRDISLKYITGTASANATAPAPMDTDTIKDLVLCDIPVLTNATSVIPTDTRADKNLCGWVFSTVGDNSFFETLDNDFYEWFKGKKDTLSSVTLFKKYVYRTQTTTSGQTKVSFDIPQYDASGVDIIDVYFNGRLQIENEDYTLSGSVITFKTAKSANQEVVVVCYKSIDGTGLGAIVDRVDALEEAVAKINSTSTYTYVCNGVNDNVMLSNIIQKLNQNSNADNFDYRSIRVVGTFGCSAPVAGSGTVDDRYKWFKFDDYEYTTNKIVLDFANCSKINITGEANTNHYIFYGYNVMIKNARIFATVSGAESSIMFINGTGGMAFFERCRIELTGGKNTYIGNRGEYVECRTSVINTAWSSYVFYLASYSFMKITGGEHYAYCPQGGTANYTSAVFGVPDTATSGVLLVNGASCPTLANGSYAQKYAVRDWSKNGKCAYNNIVSALPVDAEGQFITNTIAQSKVDYLK